MDAIADSVMFEPVETLIPCHLPALLLQNGGIIYILDVYMYVHVDRYINIHKIREDGGHNSDCLQFVPGDSTRTPGLQCGCGSNGSGCAPPTNTFAGATATALDGKGEQIRCLLLCQPALELHLALLLRLDPKYKKVERRRQDAERAHVT